MTIKQTIAAIKAIPGMTARCVDGEYRVTFTEGSNATREAMAYYTDDAQDAIGTARAMSSEA